MSSARSLLRDMGYSVYCRVRERLADDCGWRCGYCGRPVTKKPGRRNNLATIDHKIPLSRGGTWKRRNLIIACRGCNGEKGAMTAEEFEAARRAKAADERRHLAVKDISAPTG